MTNSGEFCTEVRDHGSRQIEMKSHFPLAGDRVARYVLNAWFFIPSSLGINAGDFGIDRFFAEIKCLTRFSASRVPVARLIDPDCAVSPLVRIRRELTSAATSREIPEKKILYELRSLAAIYRSESADSARILSESVIEGKLSAVKGAIKERLREVRTFLEQWHDLYALFLGTGVSGRLRSAYDWTDESIGITTEHFLTDLHGSMDDDDEARSVLKRIRSLMDAEREYRKTMGYRILAEDASPEEIERRIYRESILKKWGQSVLYLTHEESSTRRNMNHILAGIAAAVAMAFAIIVTIYAEKRFPGQSLPWATAIIVAYIFKDRIKESLRGILIHAFPSLVSDERIRLTDQASGRRIGRVSSRVRFTKARSAPPEILRLLEDDTTPFREILPEEDLVHYRRHFVIRDRVLRLHHSRLDELADIVRFNLESLLRNMDNPEKGIPGLVDGRPSEIRGHRVYPVTLVLGLSSASSPGRRYFRYRIILDREGLRRIESRG